MNKILDMICQPGVGFAFFFLLLGIGVFLRSKFKKYENALQIYLFITAFVAPILVLLLEIVLPFMGFGHTHHL
jgi:hypothetical protein